MIAMAVTLGGIHMNIQSSRTVLLAIATASVLMAGCDRSGDDRTAGQKLDAAVARTEQKTEEIKTDIKESTANAANTVADKTKDAANTVVDKTKDAAITTAVNAELVKDSKLSALKINVDTVNGRVMLRGTAPDTASRERATVLASAVSGVVSVDNSLTVVGN